MIGVQRALSSEVLKLRRTLALWAALLVPMLVIVMTTALDLSRTTGARFLAGQTTPWDGMLGIALTLWCLVALPLFVSLVTALLAGLEHREHAWRHLFALPIPRWTIYIAKLLVGGSLLCLSSCVLALGAALEGIVVSKLRPDLGLTLPIPWDEILRHTLAFTVASLLLAVQTWVAIRWSSFVVALGVGIGGTVATAVLKTVVGSSSRLASLAHIFPWSQPYVAIAQPNAGVFVIAILGGLCVAALGCWEVVRRDVA